MIHKHLSVSSLEQWNQLSTHSIDERRLTRRSMAHVVCHVGHVIVPTRNRRLLRSGGQPQRHCLRRRKKLQPRPSCLCNYSPSSPAEVKGARKCRDDGDADRGRPYGRTDDAGEEDRRLVRAYGWEVRRLVVDDGDEIREVARIQAEAFHQPVVLFDDVFLQFFQAEVLAGLMYTLRNSPPDRYACIVAEAAPKDSTKPGELVGVVDVTVHSYQDVVQHLEGEDEYLYVSGIAVSQSYRRRKVATALLEACDVLSCRLGYRYLALRAYEDDMGARTLYSNAGYEVVGSDPLWVNWVGKRRRVLMVKKLQLKL